MLGRHTAALLIIHGCQALISPRLRPVVAGQRAPSLVSIKSTVADAVNKGKAEKGKVSFLKTAYPVASAATTLASQPPKTRTLVMGTSARKASLAPGRAVAEGLGSI